MSPEPSFLATRRGKLTLAFLCGVAFLDFVDASIVNVALPSIRESLHFSIQSLQWVLRVRRKLMWEFDERLGVSGAAGSPDNTGSI
jgi:hypothetical protein